MNKERKLAGVHRRQMVGGSALAASCGGVAQQQKAVLDLTEISTRVRAYVKASARLDPGRSIWSTRAEVHAILPSGEVRPVVRVKGCEQQ
jgi:hypothetical protein